MKKDFWERMEEAFERERKEIISTSIWIAGGGAVGIAFITGNVIRSLAFGVMLFCIAIVIMTFLYTEDDEEE